MLQALPTGISVTPRGGPSDPPGDDTQTRVINSPAANLASQPGGPSDPPDDNTQTRVTNSLAANPASQPITPEEVQQHQELGKLQS